MSDKTKCAACIASRRSTVDSFFLGFRAGFRTSVIATIEGAGGVPVNEAPTFCLIHEKMATEAYVAELREVMDLKRDTPGIVDEETYDDHGLMNYLQYGD